jgi:hypothetical protein
MEFESGLEFTKGQGGQRGGKEGEGLMDECTRLRLDRSVSGMSLHSRVTIDTSNAL